MSDSKNSTHCPNCKEKNFSYWVIPLMLSGFLHEMSTSACPLTVLVDSTRNSLGGPGLLSSANSSLLGILNELVVYWLAAKTLNWCQTRGWSSTVTEFRVVYSHNQYIQDKMFNFNSTKNSQNYNERCNIPVDVKLGTRM